MYPIAIVLQISELLRQNTSFVVDMISLQIILQARASLFKNEKKTLLLPWFPCDVVICNAINDVDINIAVVRLQKNCSIQ